MYCEAPLAVIVAEVTEPEVQMLALGLMLMVVGGGKLKSNTRLMGLQMPIGHMVHEN